LFKSIRCAIFTIVLILLQEIDREIVLEVLPDLFPNIEKQNSDLSRTIMFEVVDLPRNTPGSSELEYKVGAIVQPCFLAVVCLL